MIPKSELSKKSQQDQRAIEIRKLNDALKAGQARKTSEIEDSKKA